MSDRRCAVCVLALGLAIVWGGGDDARGQAAPTSRGDGQGTGGTPSAGGLRPAGGDRSAVGAEAPELARYEFVPRVDDAGVATVTLGAGYGTRDTRIAGPQGTEQHIKVRLRPTRRLAFEAGAQSLVRQGARTRGGAQVRLLGRVLDEADAPVTLELDGGYRYDLRGDHVLGAGVTVVRHFGAVETVAAGRVEIPLTSNQGGRDEADALVSLAASVPVTDWYTQGIELSGEDLEGLWDPAEAEGGARVLLGPTFLFSFGRGVQLMGNVSAVYAPPATGATQPATSSEWGVLARGGVSYTFQ